jgi:hypothetical protein
MSSASRQRRRSQPRRPHSRCNRHRTTDTRRTPATPSPGRHPNGLPAASRTACCATHARGHPDAKVRRQREGRDHFRGTDGSADARSILGHPATVTERLISSHQAHELPTEQRASACRRSTEPLSKPGLRDPFSLGGSRSRLIWQRSIPVSRAFSRTHVRFARWSSCRKASHDVAVRREYRKCVRSVSVRSSPRQHQSADWQAL